MKATIDASQSVAVSGDVVSRKEVHTHQTTNVYKESSVRALGDMFQGVGGRPQTGPECIAKLSREVDSGIGVMPFVALVLFWPVGLYLILTAGRRKETRIDSLLVCLRGFARQDPSLQRDYAHLQKTWDRVRREKRARRKAAIWIVGGIFALAIIVPLVTAPFAVSQQQQQEREAREAREAIVRLIQEGQFEAARIRARELPYYERSDALEDIRNAERRWRR